MWRSPPPADPACPVEDAERHEYTYNRQACALLDRTGSPAQPCQRGLLSTGLPLSMQIIGKPFDEATCRVARAYEQATLGRRGIRCWRETAAGGVLAARAQHAPG